jgi:allantoicase
MNDLLSERVGGRVVECNDEFFAPAGNLIADTAPVWKEGEYTDRGKWMDGWETRRRREPGHDWCVLALGIPGQVSRVTVDTSHFTGNYPEHFSLDASPGGDVWAEMIPKTPLQGDSRLTLDVEFPHRVVVVRLNIFPDGGVARLRVEGEPIPDVEAVCPGRPVDLVEASMGGRWLEASDFHYSPPSNLLRPTDPIGMWDGWETKRRRGPGHDWATFRLGLPGEVESVVVDTRYFKGNSPGWVSVEVSRDGEIWEMVLDRAEVKPDRVNRLSLEQAVSAGFVRLSIHPDGGVARFRVMGSPDRELSGRACLRYLNSLFDTSGASFFARACASSRWVESMLSGRPFDSIDTVFERAGEAFDTLDETDWREAFAGHPRIGERGDDLANEEQSGARGHETELAGINATYEERFGFIYIVHASGKTGAEMLEIARRRLENDRVTELANASVEQRKITATRLRRMLCQEDS